MTIPSLNFDYLNKNDPFQDSGSNRYFNTAKEQNSPRAQSNCLLTQLKNKLGADSTQDLKCGYNGGRINFRKDDVEDNSMQFDNHQPFFPAYD